MGYTYDDRLARLREKKVEHTLGKKAQQGYMDADDYGTIPRPESYKFEPITKEGESYFYGVMENAINFNKFLQNHPVYIDSDEIMVGRWCDWMSLYRNPPRDMSKPSVNKDKAISKVYPYDELRADQDKYGIDTGIGSEAHCACDYNIGLEIGFGGLLEKIRYYKAINTDKEQFYNAEEIVVIAIMDFIQKHIDELKERIATETHEGRKATLQEMLETNEAIKYNPPSNFLQVCQWISWFNIVSRMYDRDGAGCNLDVVLLPFYKKDLEACIITREKAVFILADLLLIETHYYQLSGADENDKDLTNIVSYMILDAAHALNISANLTIRIHDNIDKEFLRQGVKYLFTDRNAWPRFSGDKGLLNYARNDGVSREMARKRVAVGCNWNAVPGREYPLNDCVKINLAKVWDLAVHQMFDDETAEPSIEKVMEIFKDLTQKAVDVAVKGIKHHLAHQKDVMPELVMNLMMMNCIEKGMDISECAELKTVGLDGVGLATIADSLAAMEQRIIKEGRLTWQELKDALYSDFEGTQGEYIRLMLHSSEKYCQGASLGDKWAAEITRIFVEKVRAHSVPNGIQFMPGWFSWSKTILFGKMVGATANGRKAYTPVSHGANPNPGFRLDGAATSMSNGIADVQTNYGNTCPFQIELDPKLSAEQGGIERVEQILKGHVERGGTLININILDKEKLLKAHKDPLLYPDLVVRVTGFTAYFAALSPEFRQLVVDRMIETI